jgi:hypothetical protein
LASAPTFSRLEHSVDRKDLYRLTTALVDHFIASYPEPPAALVLDLDHSDDPTHGQQEFAFYNHHYQGSPTTNDTVGEFLFSGHPGTMRAIFLTLL